MAFNIFATATSDIPLANLDANFTMIGSSAVASTLYPTATTSITYGTTGTTHYFSGSGLAVTGTLSATLDATIYGVTVGRGAGAVSTNTAVGSSALSSGSQSGSQNTAVGYQAGYSNMTATDITALGYRAAYGNTTGLYTVAIGTQAGLAITTATASTFVGAFAGQGTGVSSITGNGNTSIGASSGASLTTGTYNTFVGAAGQVNQGSGGLITTGSKNTILGGYNGNQDGLDIRTSSNVIVLSDGDGNANFVVRRNAFGGYFLSGPTKTDPSGSSYYSTVSSSGSDLQLILQRVGDAGAGWGGIGASSTAAFLVYGQGLSTTPFRVNQTNGTVILSGGYQLANGTGVTFPASQVASSDSNTLDDYEEGTWTSTLTAVSNCSSPTMTSGTYTKVGRMVYCTMAGTATVTATNATTYFIFTAPFAGASNTSIPVGSGFIGNSTNCIGIVIDNTGASTNNFGALWQAVNVVENGAARNFQIGFTYETD